MMQRNIISRHILSNQGTFCMIKRLKSINSLHQEIFCGANVQKNQEVSGDANVQKHQEVSDDAKIQKYQVEDVINRILRISNASPHANAQTKSKNIVIDFSSPNIAKPFHVGHLRSTIIGNFIANINRYYNHKVTSINYLGDWGTQFGLLKCGLQMKNIKTEDLKHDPLKILLDAYVHANKESQTDKNIIQQAREYFSDIEQGKQDLGDWKIIREITVKELQKVYNRLGITFSEYNWESDYNGNAIKNIISLLEKKGILMTDETGRKFAKVGDRYKAVLKSDNSTLYLSRDIAALLDRFERFKFDEMLYVVENGQCDHFAALFDIVGKYNEECATACKHIKFGRIQGMSTRTGNIVFLNDILDEAKNKMFEQQKESKNTRTSAMNEETCDILGTTAVIINDMKQRRIKNYEFHWDKVLQSEGDSGVKLQYLHCRLWSLEQKSGAKIPDICDPSYLKEPVIHDVIAELSKFEDILLRAKDQYEPCLIVAYLFKLAKCVNRMFNEIHVKNESADLASQRLLVFHASRLVVKKSLELLGVRPLYEM